MKKTAGKKTFIFGDNIMYHNSEKCAFNKMHKVNSSVLGILLITIALFALTACSSNNSAPSSSSTASSQPKDTAVLFEDTFQRTDATTVGAQWMEVKMRNGTGSSVPLKEDGDTPWCISGNTLSYEGVGNNTYTEDYIETVNEYPIENVMVEFEIRGTASTTLGYVGPGAFWSPSSDKRLGGFSTSDTSEQLIGVQAFYGWESQGTKGLVFRLAGKIVSTDGVLDGINQEDFVKHTITIKDGKLIYQAGNNPQIVYDLATIPESGAKRHFSFDVRYYDNGVPFNVEIKNLKITQLK